MHDTTITSAGAFFRWGPELPDLHLKLRNTPDHIYGFNHSSRNFGAYSQSSLHELYDKVCSTIEYDVDQNFVFPSLLPQAALYGWKNDYSKIIWPRNGAKKKEADEIISFMKFKKMITSTKLKEMKLDYKVVSTATHVVELTLTFEDDLGIFNESE